MVKLFPGDSQVSDYLLKSAGGQVTVALPGDGGPPPVCGVEPNQVFDEELGLVSGEGELSVVYASSAPVAG